MGFGEELTVTLDFVVDLVEDVQRPKQGWTVGLTKWDLTLRRKAVDGWINHNHALFPISQGVGSVGNKFCNLPSLFSKVRTYKKLTGRRTGGTTKTHGSDGTPNAQK